MYSLRTATTAHRSLLRAHLENHTGLSSEARVRARCHLCHATAIADSLIPILLMIRQVSSLPSIERYASTRSTCSFLSPMSPRSASENRDRFESACRLPSPLLETLRAAADKANIVRLALELGVPAPRTEFVE